MEDLLNTDDVEVARLVTALKLVEQANAKSERHEDPDTKLDRLLKAFDKAYKAVIKTSCDET